jgi:hypothetical protein
MEGGAYEAAAAPGRVQKHGSGEVRKKGSRSGAPVVGSIVVEGWDECGSDKPEVQKIGQVEKTAWVPGSCAGFMAGLDGVGRQPCLRNCTAEDSCVQYC